MGKHFNEYSAPYQARRSANYNPNRSCENGCSENSARCRGYEAEYAGRTFHPCAGSEAAGRAYGPCCENQCGERENEPCCANEYIQPSSAYGERRGDSCGSCPAELHLHEVQGSTKVAGGGCEAHSHRYAAVTSEPVILKNGRHAHRLTFRTDTYDGHCHEFCGMTTEEYEICGGHVHYCEGKTSQQDGHCHEFRFITHIENPTENG